MDRIGSSTLTFSREAHLRSDAGGLLLEKAFGGKARYSWDADDGSLLATWKKA